MTERSTTYRLLERLLRAVRDATHAELVTLAPALAALATEAMLCLVRAENQTSGANAPERLLSVKETASRLGMSRSWVYQNGARLPFASRVGRRLLFSESGLEAWLREERAGGRAGPRHVSM